MSQELGPKYLFRRPSEVLGTLTGYYVVNMESRLKSFLRKTLNLFPCLVTY